MLELRKGFCSLESPCAFVHLHTINNGEVVCCLSRRGWIVDCLRIFLDLQGSTLISMWQSCHKVEISCDCSVLNKVMKKNESCSFYRWPVVGCHLFDTNNVKVKASQTVTYFLPWDDMWEVAYQFYRHLRPRIRCKCSLFGSSKCDLMAEKLPPPGSVSSSPSSALSVVFAAELDF